MWLGATFFHGDALLGRFVLNVLDEASERPDVVPLRLRKPLAYIGQVLEHDYVAVVLDSFLNNFVSDRVDVLFSLRFFALPESKQGVVRGSGAALLHLTTPLLKLAAPMVVVVSLPERSS